MYTRFLWVIFSFYSALNNKVGVIGLGLMGSQLAMRLINAGYYISIYNRSDEKTKPFEKLDVHIARSPMALAEACDFLLICVTDFEAVKKICFGADGITAANRKDLVVADSSTISPEQSRHNAEILRRNEIEMLGMPLMGGPTAARDGRLVAIIATAISEGITLVRASGIDPGIFIKILNSTYFKTGLSEIKGPKMVNNNFEPSFHLKNMLKDLELTISTAQDRGVSIPLAGLTQQIYQAANNSGFSDYDYTAILGFMQKINGIHV